MHEPEKIAGILTPVFALRTKGCLGIGDTQALIEFIDWAAAVGFQVVKLLPISETGTNNSPYSAISSVALDYTLLRISPEKIPHLEPQKYRELAEIVDLQEVRVDYSRVRKLKLQLLEAAYEGFLQADKSNRGEGFGKFQDEHKGWLDEYTLFRVLLEVHGSEMWDGWPEGQRDFVSALEFLDSLDDEERALIERRRTFFSYVQWMAFGQWEDVRKHAAAKGVRLMGDIPFGLNYYSADVWAKPHLFCSGLYGGTPQEAVFSHDRFLQQWGQNWGIPVYDWEVMSSDDFAWWRQRVRITRRFFDLFRIDHILGFYRVYTFPWPPQMNAKYLDRSAAEVEAELGNLPGFKPRADNTAEHMRMNQEDGERLLRVVLEEAGAGNVVGEDLGMVPDYVRPSLRKLGIAGYKVPQWEKHTEDELISGERYERLSLATFATHDHEPLRAMWETLVRDEGADSQTRRRVLLHFIGHSCEVNASFTPELHLAFLRAIFASNSWLAVIMITDVLALSDRINLPGVEGNQNWTFRMPVPVADLSGLPISQDLRCLLLETSRIHIQYMDTDSVSRLPTSRTERS